MKIEPHGVRTPFGLSLLILLLAHENAHAYLDLGTGSYIFQLLVAGFLGILFAIKTYWKSLKAFFGSKFSKKQKPRNK